MKRVTKAEYRKLQEVYASNAWSCTVPPVLTAHWDERSWIAHIFGAREETDPLAPVPGLTETASDDEPAMYDYDEDDGQPTAYEEWQDYYGGDDPFEGEYL